MKFNSVTILRILSVLRQQLCLHVDLELLRTSQLWNKLHKYYCQKCSQFETGCKDDSGYVTQLKQQKSKRWYYLAVHRHIVNVLTSNITFFRDERSQFIEDTVEPSVFLPGIISLVIMCIGIIWNNSFLVGGRARAEARIEPRPLRTSRSILHMAPKWFDHWTTWAGN